MTRPPELSPEPPLQELSSLARDLEPPRALEDRVVDALAGERLLRQRRVPWLRIAAAVAIFAAGAFAGRLSAPLLSGESVGSAQPRFLLLLLTGNETGSEADRVAAYRAWAVAQRAAGRQISGERLAAEGVLVQQGAANASARDELQGFFLISGASLDDAAAAARSSPHVQGGGRVIVRPIDTR